MAQKYQSAKAENLLKLGVDGLGLHDAAKLFLPL